MLGKTDQWESYTDKAGRRHWRWPASGAPVARDERENAESARQRSGWTAPQLAPFAALPARDR